MDFDETDQSDEALFHVLSSQASNEDSWGNDFDDDEMLDDGLEEIAIPWVLASSSPQPTSAREHVDPATSKVQASFEYGELADTSDPIALDHVDRFQKDREWVIARIEEMLENIVDGLLGEKKSISITLKSRSGLTRRTAGLPTGSSSLPPKVAEIGFPGATAQEAWKFTVLVRMLEIVHASLIDDVVVTKRQVMFERGSGGCPDLFSDIYYRDPDLFMKQSVVDRYVDDLACTLNISRSQLNVGVLVPKLHKGDKLHLDDVEVILILEKEATFRSLLTSSHWSRMISHTLVLTAKGYPDLATRQFLGIMASQCPNIPTFMLADFDPDGIGIMSTYKYGSYRLAHEAMTDQGTLSLDLPRLRWLGVYSDQIRQLVNQVNGGEVGTATDVRGLMRLSARDRNKASRMLEWDICTEKGQEQEWRHQLQVMLMLNIKAEMQILEELSGGLARWIFEEITKNLYSP
ncbi:meiosis-specific topoisomerase Spo11 [Polyplosphaeria fusca]|uniref:DNA topoisomerase (ATP-hydrolyzing) n=1 Tax=Polyplosphaeria fusca TaxID=682080 RepID=A0A9P4QKP1_9PLEO|nr:meiosis-specific topoisomerase Spo11 [Polyplosphaeria fusca]